MPSGGCPSNAYGYYSSPLGAAYASQISNSRGRGWGSSLWGLIFFLALLYLLYSLSRGCFQGPRTVGVEESAVIYGPKGSEMEESLAVYGDTSGPRCPPDSAPIPLSPPDLVPPIEAYRPPQPDQGVVPATPNIAFPAGGVAFDSEVFLPSEATEEYYQTFNPRDLSSAMPLSWRPSPPQCPVEDQEAFDEFSRYAISPGQLSKSTSMAAVMRLAESTREGNSRTLGSQSLLRNAVTPTSPIPTGNSEFVFLDSSVRQGYIAAATGRFPSTISC